MPRGNKRTAHSWTAILPLWMTLAVCVLLTQNNLVPGVEATITVMDSGRKFPMKQDTEMGKTLWHGYEYYARLQYLEDHMQLCPPATTPEKDWHRNVTVPPDGIPVALLVRNGGCPLRDKARYVVDYVLPPGAVHFLIVDGSDNDQLTDADKISSFLLEENLIVNQEDWEEELTLETLVLDGQSSFQNDQLEVPIPIQDDENYFNNLDDDTMSNANANAIQRIYRTTSSHHNHREHSGTPEFPSLYIIHVSFHTEYDLLEILLNQDPESKIAGGPRITIDARPGTSGFLGSDAAVWIAVCAMLSACACSCLLLGVDDATVEPAPVRPTRRRLTREQVRSLFPVWRYDGHALHLVPPRNMEETDERAELTEGSEPPEPPPVPSDMECSICLDDYEPGDKLRVLPCHHTFHSKCVGRWLYERHAVCPLCKEDLYVEEDEEEEESVAPEGSGTTQIRERRTFWSRVRQSLVRAATADEDNNGEPAGEAEAATPDDAAAVAGNNEPETPSPAGTASQRRSTTSFWRRLFGRPPAEVETTNMLTEPLLTVEEHVVDEEAPAAAVITDVDDEPAMVPLEETTPRAATEDPVNETTAAAAAAATAIADDLDEECQSAPATPHSVENVRQVTI